MILFWALLTFLPSCVCIFICYLRIFYTARRHAHEISAMETSLRKRLKIQFIRKDARYAKTLAIVISVFLILCLPIQVGVASAFFIVPLPPPTVPQHNGLKLNEIDAFIAWSKNYFP